MGIAKCCFTLGIALACLGFAIAKGLDPASLKSRIRKLESSLPGAKLGVAIKDLSSGHTFLYHGDERFPLQSVFKLPLGVVVLRVYERRKLNLGKMVLVEQKDLSVPYSAINLEIGDGSKQYTVKRLIELASGGSDNTAADVLMRMLGGPRKVTAELLGMGVRGIRIDRLERDLQRNNDGLGAFVPALTREDNFVAAMNRVPDDEKRRAMSTYLSDPRDTSTPRGMMSFLEGLQAGRFLAKTSMKFFMEVLTKTTTGKHRLIQGLPSGTILAHKTGTGREVAGRVGAVNDVGIATLPSGHRLIIVVFLSGSRGTDASLDRVVAEVARAAVEAARSHK